jgi:hypothetical protein
VIEYVLGDAGLVADLSAPGNMTAVLTQALQKTILSADDLVRQRRESVRFRFDWEVLRPQYLEMFRACAKDLVASIQAAP